MSNLSLKTGFTPVQTRVTLANNATTVVQNFAAYDAQELTGFVYIDATTDLRAAVKVTVFKNGAGTYEIAISDVAGDLNSGAPIVSFSISSAGVLSATLVSFAGYVTAYIQFNLNAPALGGQFPLQVDGANVGLATSSVQGAYKAGQAPGLLTGATIASGYIGEVYRTSYSGGSMTSTVASRAAIISLPSAGVWAVYQQGGFTGTATSFTVCESSISTTDAFSSTRSATVSYSANSIVAVSLAPIVEWSQNIQPIVISSSSANPQLYIWGKATFLGGTCNQTGFITAIRIG